MARKRAAAQLVGPEPFLCLWRHVLQREIRKPVEHKRSQFWMETGRLSRPMGGTLTAEGPRFAQEEESQIADRISYGA